LLHLVATSFRVRFGPLLGLAVACRFSVRARLPGRPRAAASAATPRRRPLPWWSTVRSAVCVSPATARTTCASVSYEEDRPLRLREHRCKSLGGVLMLASCVAAHTVGGRFVGPHGVRPDEHLCVADAYGTTARSLPASIVWSFLAKDKLCVGTATVAERAPQLGPLDTSGWRAVRSRCALCDAPFSVLICSVLHHSAHVAHAARHARSDLLGRLGDDRFGHENVLRDRGGVL
jgi:hypothetical protein